MPVSAPFTDLIARKRDGGALAPAEWRRVITAVTEGSVPDYQLAALLMAVYIRGMSEEETLAVTEAMAASGERLTWPAGPFADKHSTGGVGDKVTLVAVPWAAACGVRVPKLSGRALGLTGGTLDKLASIPGFDAGLTPARFREVVAEAGWAIAAAGDVAPADKALYALRDATATVASVPLIVASVLSKKLAGGAPAFVFDVKCGRGAFARDEPTAFDLADRLTRTAAAAGRRAVALVTRMDQPLGRAVGNALEVEEAALALAGDGAPDLMEVSRAVATALVEITGVAAGEEAAAVLDNAMATGGAARDRLDAMVGAQGASADWLSRLPRAAKVYDVRATAGGHISALDALTVARAAHALGAGRLRKEEDIDASVGVVLERKEGDAVEPGDVVMLLHYNDEERLPAAAAVAERSFVIGPAPPPAAMIIRRFDACLDT